MSVEINFALLRSTIRCNSIPNDDNTCSGLQLSCFASWKLYFCRTKSSCLSFNADKTSFTWVFRETQSHLCATHTCKSGFTGFIHFVEECVSKIHIVCIFFWLDSDFWQIWHWHWLRLTNATGLLLCQMTLLALTDLCLALSWQPYLENIIWLKQNKMHS